MKKAISLLSILLCFCMLMVGCGEKPVTGSNGSDVGGEIIPDASGVSDVVSSGSIEDEISHTDPMESDVSQNSTTTTGNVVGTVKTTANKAYQSYPINEWPMPTGTVTNKEVTFFGWGNLDTSDKGDHLVPFQIMEKEYGVKWTGIASTFQFYWDDLAKLIAADKSPDLVQLPNYDFYPRAVTKNLVQPLDELIDFNDPIWDNVRESLNELKWKEKTYFPLDSVYLNSLFYYNTKMFRDFGIDKMPKDYFLEGNWTWDVFVELANQFVTKNPDGSIKTAGYGQGPDAMHVSTGVELVEYSPTTGYKLNLKDKKLAQYFNMLHGLGQGGTKAWLWPDYWYKAYDKGQIAMMTCETSSLVSKTDLSKDTLKNTEVVPMPRMDKNSKYYLQVHYRLSCGIPVGAKNTEAAKQFILLSHWAKLGTPFLDVMPREKNSCMKKYNYGDVDETLMTKARVKWLNEMLSMYEYTHIGMMWQSWAGGGYTRIPGEYEVYCGESWASCVSKNYPKINAAIKMHFR